MKKVLFMLVFLFNLSMAQWQIPKGDINAQDNDGYTALIRATMNNDLGTVKALINAGADLNIQDDFGLTALIMASMRGYRNSKGFSSSKCLS